MSDVQAWESFAVMTGGASAALTGLLFVGVSINREQVVRDRALRAGAAQTLVLFVVPLLLATLLLVPQQRRWAFSVELIVVGALAAVVLFRVQRHSPKERTSRLAELADRRETTLTTTVFILAAAGTYWAGHGGGLYWLVPAVVLAIVGGVVNAWLFLVGDL